MFALPLLRRWWLLAAAGGWCALGAGCFEAPRLTERGLAPLEVAAPQRPLLAADDWPAFRGGAHQGVSPAAALPLEWTATRGVRWRVRLGGEGHSSPIIVGANVLLTTAIEESGRLELFLLCFDRATGDLRWRRSVGQPTGRTHRKNGYASPTPVSDGVYVVCYTPGAGLYCYDLEGRRLWRTELSAGDQQWGQASSPVLVDALAIQLCDTESESYLVAVNLANGQPRWRTPRQSRGCWATPVVVETLVHGALRREIIVNGTGSSDGSAGWVIAYDAADGRELWRCRATTDIPCPTLIVGEGLLVASSGGNGPLVALRPGGEGEISPDATLWRRETGGPYVPTGLLYEGRLWVLGDGGLLASYDAATGAPLSTRRLRGTYSASLVAGAGHVYAASEQGDVYVFDAHGGDEPVAVNRLEERCLATPAIAAGELYFRTERHLWCIERADEPADSPVAAPALDRPIRSPSDADSRIEARLDTAAPETAM